MPSEPSRTDGMDEEGSATAGAAGDSATAGWSSSLVFGHVLQKRRRRHEEQISGDGAAEVEQPVVVAGRPADEHVLEHLLDGAGRTAVADEIGAKFTMRGPAEGHVVAQDLDLFPVLDDGRERVVRRGWLDGIVQFDVGQLGAADDAFLRFGGERIPCVKIVEIFLHDDVAAAGKIGRPRRR